jgi:hypothetical protein
MANEPISQLNPLTATQASRYDLVPVVDVSSTASPTGETKKMELGELASFVAAQASSSFQAITEQVPSSEAPGVVVGNLVRRSGSLFVTASAASSSLSNVVGIVESVGGGFVRIVHSGFVNFGTSLVADGTVYYLGVNGDLDSSDPVLSNPAYVSKPVFIGRGTTSGWFFNQRGLQSDEVKFYTGQFSSPMRYNNGLDLSRGTGSAALSGSRATLSSVQTIDSSSFSLSFVVKTAPYVEIEDHVLLSLTETSDSSTLNSATQDMLVYISSSNALSFRLRDGGTGAFREATIPNFIERFGGNMTNVTFVRESGSNTPAIYTNGAPDGSVVTSSFGSPTAWGSYNLRNNFVHLNRNPSAVQINPFSTYAVYVYNRALSSSEINAQYVVGIDQSDKWGNNSVITSGALIPGRRYRIVTTSSYIGAGPFWYDTAPSLLNEVGFEWLVTKDKGPLNFSSGSLRQIGSVFALEPDSVQPSPSQWKDVSPSRSHLTQNQSGVNHIRPMSKFIISHNISGSRYLGLSGTEQTNVLPNGFVITSFSVRSDINTTISVGSSTGNPTDRMGNTSILAGVAYLIVVAGNPPNQFVRSLYVSSTPSANLRLTIEGYIAD